MCSGFKPTTANHRLAQSPFVMALSPVEARVGVEQVACAGVNRYRGLGLARFQSHGMRSQFGIRTGSQASDIE